MNTSDTTSEDKKARLARLYNTLSVLQAEIDSLEGELKPPHPAEDMRGKMFKFEDQVSKTYYRGMSLFKFQSGEYGLAWETMNKELMSVFYGRFPDFESMMTEADRHADWNHCYLPKIWDPAKATLDGRKRTSKERPVK
jgi:hypothetical protein